MRDGFLYKKKHGKVFHIYEHPIELDTETAWNHDDDNQICWINQWGLIFTIDGDEYKCGRRPSDLMKTLRMIQRRLDLADDECVVVYIHNAGYDWSYLDSYFEEELGKGEKLFIAPHVLLEARYGHFIFRDSYRWSNRSLETWGKDLGIDHPKKVGLYDYEKIIYQDSDLTEDEKTYMYFDCLALKECIEKQLSLYGDDLASVPLTSTGYIRRDARSRYLKDPFGYQNFLKTRLTAQTYALFKEEFAGGFTHGNRHHDDETVYPDLEKGQRIKHRDFKSHYPSQMRTRKFPTGSLVYASRDCTLERLGEFLKEGKGFICKIFLVNPKLKNVSTAFPYLQWCKLTKNFVLGSNFLDVTPEEQKELMAEGYFFMPDHLVDNGRVLRATGIFGLCVNDLDLDIILKQYDFDSYFLTDVWTYKLDYLPKWLTDTVDDYFLSKSRLKAEVKKEESKPSPDRDVLADLQLHLMKAKNGLNGIAGMCETDPIRSVVTYDDISKWHETRPDDIGKKLSLYYHNRNNFMPFQWGCQITALGRHELFEAIWLIEENGGEVLYCDTDSCFYIATDETEEAFEKWNKEKEQVFVEVDGKKEFYDQFNDEEEDIISFRFLHAKCYAYEVRQGDGSISLKCTIAGVPERILDHFAKPGEELKNGKIAKGGEHVYFFRQDELESIERLTSDTEFVRCGGTSATYVVNQNCLVDGHLTETRGGCIIKKTNKTIHSMLSVLEKEVWYAKAVESW